MLNMDEMNDVMEEHRRRFHRTPNVTGLTLDQMQTVVGLMKDGIENNEEVTTDVIQDELELQSPPDGALT